MIRCREDFPAGKLSKAHHIEVFTASEVSDSVVSFDTCQYISLVRILV